MPPLRVGVPPGTLTLWPDGSLGVAEGVYVPSAQRNVHVAAEAVAVFAVTPFMIYLSTRSTLPMWARVASGVIAAGTLAIDGGLLWRFTTAE